jgi:hypothetical protein
MTDYQTLQDEVQDEVQDLRQRVLGLEGLLTQISVQMNDLIVRIDRQPARRTWWIVIVMGLAGGTTWRAGEDTDA